MLSPGHLPENLEQRTDEHLVAVRPDILSDAEHALGNLLQRIHHVARVSRERLGAHGERLQGAVEDLEHVLELLFDYVSPVELQMRPTDAARIAESLVGQVRGHTSGELIVGACPSIPMVVDPRMLSRSFHLLGEAMAREWEVAVRTSIEVVHNEPLDRAEFAISLQSGGGGRCLVDGSLALAVATRLLEAHGGELCRESSGEVSTCVVILPVPRSIHASA